MRERTQSRYNLVYTPQAETDLRHTFRYIAYELRNSVSAHKLLSRIERSADKLRENPNAYTLVNDERLARLGIRRIFVKNYTLFFTVDENTRTVSMLRVLYSRRDWSALL